MPALAASTSAEASPSTVCCLAIEVRISTVPLPTLRSANSTSVPSATGRPSASVTTAVTRIRAPTATSPAGAVRAMLAGPLLTRNVWLQVLRSTSASMVYSPACSAAAALASTSSSICGLPRVSSLSPVPASLGSQRALIPAGLLLPSGPLIVSRWSGIARTAPPVMIGNVPGTSTGLPPSSSPVTGSSAISRLSKSAPLSGVPTFSRLVAGWPIRSVLNSPAMATLSRSVNCRPAVETTCARTIAVPGRAFDGAVSVSRI